MNARRCGLVVGNDPEGVSSRQPRDEGKGRSNRDGSNLDAWILAVCYVRVSTKVTSVVSGYQFGALPSSKECL